MFVVYNIIYNYLWFNCSQHTTLYFLFYSLSHSPPSLSLLSLPIMGFFFIEYKSHIEYFWLLFLVLMSSINTSSLMAKGSSLREGAPKQIRLMEGDLLQLQLQLLLVAPGQWLHCPQSLMRNQRLSRTFDCCWQPCVSSKREKNSYVVPDHWSVLVILAEDAAPCLFFIMLQYPSWCAQQFVLHLGGS